MDALWLSDALAMPYVALSDAQCGSEWWGQACVARLVWNQPGLWLLVMPDVAPSDALCGAKWCPVWRLVMPCVAPSDALCGA